MDASLWRDVEECMMFVTYTNANIPITPTSTIFINQSNLDTIISNFGKTGRKNTPDYATMSLSSAGA